MTFKTETTNVTDIDEHRDERTQPPAPIQSLPHPSAISNPTCDKMVFFDATPVAFGYSSGLASVTLAARRQLVDTSGQVFEDLVITALLRAPMHALRQLRDCVNEIEKLEAQQAAAAVAALERPAGSVVH